MHVQSGAREWQAQDGDELQHRSRSSGLVSSPDGSRGERTGGGPVNPVDREAAGALGLGEQQVGEGPVFRSPGWPPRDYCQNGGAAVWQPSVSEGTEGVEAEALTFSSDRRNRMPRGVPQQASGRCKMHEGAHLARSAPSCICRLFNTSVCSAGLSQNLQAQSPRQR